MTNVVPLVVGGQTYFCPEISQVKDFLREVRPTVFLGVPRVWEKFEAALRSRLGQAQGIRRSLATWAMDTELSCFREQKGSNQNMSFKRRIARKLVVDKVKTALGLERLEIAITGSAPMSPHTQEFFASLGICILEVYGLTETSGVATISDPKEPVFGTVGKLIRDMEIRFAEEDEIQLRGPNLVRGYRGMPEQTKELFTDDGWLRTGDAGNLDSAGNLRITGRLKELIITAGGKNIAPVELEFYVNSIVGIGQSVVVGDRKPYLSMLLVLDPENLGTLAHAAGTSQKTMAELARDPLVHAYLEREIETHCNSHVARYQTIKKIAILPEEFSIEGGELTVSMKLRRSVINKKYHDAIEKLYTSETPRQVTTQRL